MGGGGLGNTWGSTTSLAQAGSQIMLRSAELGGAAQGFPGGAVIAQPPGRSEVARLAPAVLLKVHTEPCAGLAVTSDTVLTACYAGLVRRVALLLRSGVLAPAVACAVTLLLGCSFPPPRR